MEKLATICINARCVHTVGPNEARLAPTSVNDFFNLLKDKITIYGVKGININSAEKDVLESLDAQITEEVLNAILERRDNPEKGGPFKSSEDFLSFLEGEDVNTEEFNKDGIPLLFGTEHNFVIKSVGTYGLSLIHI